MKDSLRTIACHAYRFPLPDVIIAATATQANASLITADQQLKIIQEVTVVDFLP